MISLSELLQSNSSTQNGNCSDLDDSTDNVTNDDNLWREVGPRNRSLPIRTAKVINTPVQEIFGGSLFSIRTAGKDRCGHRSPFFDLQLDISVSLVRMCISSTLNSTSRANYLNPTYRAIMSNLYKMQSSLSQPQKLFMIFTAPKLSKSWMLKDEHPSTSYHPS